MATLATEVNFRDWSIDAPTVGPRGNKSSRISQNGQAIRLQLCPTGQGMKAPFGATTYANEERSRMNFDLQVADEQLLGRLREIDEWFAQQLGSGSEYRPPVAEKGNYLPLLKTKMDITRVRCWSPSGDRMPTNGVDWGSSVFTRIMIVSRVWCMNRRMDVTLEVIDLVVLDAPTEPNTFPIIRGDPCQM